MHNAVKVAGSGRRVFVASEYGEVAIPVAEFLIGGTLSIYPEVLSKRVLGVRVGNAGELVLVARNYIGLIPLSDRIAVRIVPRVPVGNLTRIVRLAGHVPTAVERYATRYDEAHDPLTGLEDALADAFAAAFEEVARRGLLETYHEVGGDTSRLRGRVKLTQTLRRWHAQGQRVKVYSAWFERSADNSANQLLKYVAWAIARRCKNSATHNDALLGRLNRAYPLFRSVQLDRSLSFLRAEIDWEASQLPRSRPYYVPAVQLARLFVRNRGIDLDRMGDRVSLPPLLVNMEDAAEGYIRNVLQAGLAVPNARVRVLDGNKPVREGGARRVFFDTGSRAPATPDIVVTNSVDGTPLVVVEVKYKPIKGDPSRDDINQVIAYGLAYQVSRVVIAHPSMVGQSRLNLVGVLKGISVYAFAYDLNGDLVEAEAIFTRAIASLAYSSI